MLQWCTGGCCFFSLAPLGKKLLIIEAVVNNHRRSGLNPEQLTRVANATSVLTLLHGVVPPMVFVLSPTM